MTPVHPAGGVKATAACLAPMAGLTCLPRAWHMKSCSSLICYRFFISPHESSELRRVTTVCLDHPTPTCIKEPFAVQAVPLRWIKASRSIGYAGRSSLAQRKHHCHKSVFWRGNLYCCTWESNSIIQHQLCASLLLARQISARACQRGWWAGDGSLPSSHTYGTQGCALQLCGDLVLHPTAWVHPCQNNHRQPWALAVIPLGSVHAPPAGKPSWLHSSLTSSSQQSRRDTWLWPPGVGTTITLVPWCVHRVQSQAPAGARSNTPACQPPQHPHGLVI